MRYDKRIIFNRDKKYLIYFVVNQYNFIKDSKLYVFQPKNSELLDTLDKHFGNNDLVAIHINHLKRIVKKFDKDMEYTKYLSKSSGWSNIKSTIYRGFDFLDPYYSYEEVVDYETKPSRYIRRANIKA